MLLRSLPLTAVLLTVLSSPAAVWAQELVRPAKLLTLTDPSIESIRTFPAEVKARKRTELAFRVPGQLADIYVTEGQSVKQGDLLARLDPADYEVSVQRHAAEYTLAQQQFERIRSLLERKLVSQAQFDEKQAQLNVGRSLLRQARLNLEYTEIHAPYAGVISRRLVDDFENLQAKQPVLIMQSDDEIDLEFQISESLVSLEVRPDAESGEADVEFDAIPDRMFKARLRERSATADQGTGGYTVTLSMQQPEKLNIYPGMSARVTVDLSDFVVIDDQAYILPVEALISADDTAIESTLRQLWLVNPETMVVYRQDVEVGRVSSKGVEVLSGVKAGDIVVTAGANYMREGMKVRPWQRERGL